MYPNLISGPKYFLACIASALIFLSVGLALPYLAGSGDMAVAMVWFFFVQPLSLVMLCVVFCVVCAQRARTLGLAWGWGLAIPVLIALDWRWVLFAPMRLIEPSAFPFRPPFPWEACSAIVLIVAATILQAGAFSVDAMGARLATYAMLLFLLMAVLAGYAGDYHWLGTKVSQMACGGLAASAIALWIGTLGKHRAI